MASIYDLSTSEASNSQTAGWNTAENQDPSTVNDGMRRAKEIIAAFRDDLGGYLAGGTANALTVTPSSVAGALAYSSYATGQMFMFRSASANTTSVSLNVNSIGAKELRKIVGGADVSLVAGDILPQVRYNAIYSTSVNSGNGGHILLNPSNPVIGGQISFPATQVSSSDANTLDDYEEGTWTPADASGAALTFSSAVGFYTKIGRLVIAHATATYPSTADVTAAAIGLPFTNTNLNALFVPIGSALSGGTVPATRTRIAPGGGAAQFFSAAGAAVTNANLSTATINFTVAFFAS